MLLFYVYTSHAAPSDLRWQIKVGENLGSSVAVDSDSGNFFVGDANFQLKAYSNTNDQLWRFQAKGYISSTPLIDENNQVIFGDHSGRVYALDIDTGEANWVFDAGQPIKSSITVSDDTVYVGTDSGYIYALESITGVPLWSFNSGSSVGGSPVFDPNGILYFGTENGQLFAVSTDEYATPRLKWTFLLSPGDGVVSPILNGKGQLYVGSESGRFYALDVNKTNPTLKWVVKLGDGISSSPVIGDKGELYISTYNNGEVFSIDSASGFIKWRYETGAKIYSSPAIGNDGVIYLGSLEQKIYAINSMPDLLVPICNGICIFIPVTPKDRVAWVYDADSSVISSPLIYENNLFITSKNGSLMGLEVSSSTLQSSPWPMYRKNIERQAN